MLAACILLTLALAAGALAAGALAVRRPPPRPPPPNSVGIMLGSGGHTAEMLQLIRTLPHGEFHPRVYLVSEGDVHSLARARALEGALAPHPLQALVLPRARAVGQSWLSTPFTVVWSTIYTIWALATRPVWLGARRPRVDVLLMNGPATCVPLCIAVWCLRITGAPSPAMVYIESFARVHSLSLTARIVRHMVDRFVVQWPTADPHATCTGVLV